jgi:hypothetical protein
MESADKFPDEVETGKVDGGRESPSPRDKQASSAKYQRDTTKSQKSTNVFNLLDLTVLSLF